MSMQGMMKNTPGPGQCSKWWQPWYDNEICDGDIYDNDDIIDNDICDDGFFDGDIYNGDMWFYKAY